MLKIHDRSVINYYRSIEICIVTNISSSPFILTSLRTVVTSDASFFLSLSFSSYSTLNFPTKISLLLPGNKCDRIEPLTQWAESFQFVIDYFFSKIWPTGLVFLCHHRFLTTAQHTLQQQRFSASTDLFIDLWLIADDVITSRPVRASVRAIMCVFGAGIPAIPRLAARLQRRQGIFSLETLDSSFRYYSLSINLYPLSLH